ncbi:transposase family protein [Roseovarius gahaiensis]|uniref:Transposase family protein n=1 Tax=Roseovarius gahaiensis TaxID=2716691 RepID=A0A967EGU7_9RHOB|nr:integrase core domain-containing protein [Roseovarius gahaiensis]NHQ75065.1 transposase family protein [Roseovarius gahaiensis]
MIDQIRIGKTSLRLRANSTLFRFGPDPLISIPARGFWTCRTSRPERRPHSITRRQESESSCMTGGNQRSRKIVGWEVHEREGVELAAVLIRQAVLAEGCTLRPLVLHADNGSPMKGATMKTTMEKLGITASYSRPRVINDNPFSEALFRTCKYRQDWPRKGFATKADAQSWVKSFVGWYNCDHLHSAIRFVTPDARHTGHDRATLANRASLYANARTQNPQRWSGKTRNWQPAGPVWLNPKTENSAPEIRDAA